MIFGTAGAAAAPRNPSATAFRPRTFAFDEANRSIKFGMAPATGRPKVACPHHIVDVLSAALPQDRQEHAIPLLRQEPRFQLFQLR